jgi:hypothetical protein
MRENVFQQVSPASILQGRLCGLCGNNNYDISDDIRSLEGKLIGSRQFVMDNVMPSESCDAGDYESQLRYRHEGFTVANSKLTAWRDSFRMYIGIHLLLLLLLLLILWTWNATYRIYLAAGFFKKWNRGVAAGI